MIFKDPGETGMNQLIDCFLVGHNLMDFRKYEETVRRMGTGSRAYRDLNNHFIQYNNKSYMVPEAFDLFCANDIPGGPVKPLNPWEIFSAAIAYLGTYLHRRGFAFDYINSFQDEKEEFAKKLTAGNILTIAITTTYYVNAFAIIEIIDFIKSYNREAKIIVGGPYISSQVRAVNAQELESLFKSTIGADFYVNSSQGETALVNIIHALKNGLPPDNIKNIYYKTGNGYKANAVEREDNKLSENMVDWDLFADSVGAHVNIRTAVSCPFSCAFCRFPEHAGRYQTADIEALERELNLLNKIKSLKCVDFIDDTFNIPPARIKKILRMFIKNKYRFRWYSYFRPQFADKEMVQLMKESGCLGVYMGLESGSNQILRNMRKATTVEKNCQGIALLKEKGIVTYGNFIIGFPGETGKTVRETIKLIEENQLDFYRAQLWFCEPMAPIAQEREKYQIKGESFEWSHATMDSKTACDLVDEVLLTVKKSIWVPHFNFNFDGVWRLVHRGLHLRQVKNFLNAFNRGLKEKLINPYQREIPHEVVEQLKVSCWLPHDLNRPTSHPGKKKGIHPSEAEFDF